MSTSTTYEKIGKELSASKAPSILVLHGEEGYYIDQLVKRLEQLLPEEDRDYALTNIYAPEVDNAQRVIDVCRQLPMMTDRQVVILRECQSARADFLDRLAPYVTSPTPSTVLAIVSRGEALKGKNLLKAIKASEAAVVFESKRPAPWDMPKYISGYITQKQMGVDPKAVEMLQDFIGTNLSTLFNEIDKLAEILGPGARVTPEAVERNIGISKDYNNFELLEAVAKRDFGKSMLIVSYFRANPKENPYVTTAATLFGFFADLMQLHYTRDKSESGIMSALGIRTLAARRALAGLKNYNAWQVIEILDAIRRYDAQSKGAGSRTDPYLLLNDLIYKIHTASGKLPV